MSLAKFKASITATDGEGRMFSLDEARQAIAEVKALEEENARLRAKLELTPENVGRVARYMLRERHPCWSIVAEIFDRSSKQYNLDGQADEMRSFATAAIKALGDE